MGVMNKFRTRGTKTIPQSVTPHRAKAQLRWILRMGTFKKQPLEFVMALAERIKEGKPKRKPFDPELNHFMDGGRVFSLGLIFIDNDRAKPYVTRVYPRLKKDIDLRKRFKRKT